MLSTRIFNPDQPGHAFSWKPVQQRFAEAYMAEVLNVWPATLSQGSPRSIRHIRYLHYDQQQKQDYNYEVVLGIPNHIFIFIATKCCIHP